MLRGDIETGEMNEDGLRELRHEVERFAANQSSNNRATDHYWNEMGPDNMVAVFVPLRPSSRKTEAKSKCSTQVLYLVDCGRVTTEAMTGTKYLASIR